MAISKQLKSIDYEDFGGLKRYTKYLLTTQEKNEHKERIWFIDSSIMSINKDKIISDRNYKNKISRRYEALYRHYSNMSYEQKSTNKKYPKNLVIRYIISFDDRDIITEEKAKEINKEFIKLVAGNERLYDAIGHIDSDHKHIHGFFSNVDKSGKLFSSQSYTKLKMFDAMRLLEEKYKLTKLEVKAFENSYKKTTEEYFIEQRGEVAKKSRVAEDIKELHKLDLRFDQLFNKLVYDFNLIPVPSRRKATNEIYGWSFTDKITGDTYKASSLNRNLSWNKVKEKYNEEIHGHLFDKFNIKEEPKIIVSSPKTKKKVNNLEIKKFRKSLYQYYFKKENSFYNKNTGKKAFEVEKNTITVINTNNNTLKAALQYANLKFEDITAHGNKDFKRQVWLQNEILKITNKNHSLNIKNYKPSESDLYLLEKTLEDYNLRTDNNFKIEEEYKKKIKLKR